MLNGPPAWFEVWSERSVRAVLLLLTSSAVYGLAGCASADTNSPSSNGGASATGGSGGMAGHGAEVALSIRAEAADGGELDAMNLKASSVSDIVVHATPEGAHALRFSLIGTPLDAVLSATDGVTDETSGEAHVTLIAPSTPTTFSVRATSAGANPAVLDLAVPMTNMALLAVKPSYGGERVVKSYTASAWQNTTCAELTGSPPPDSDISASGDRWPVALTVPTNTKLAVILRAGHFAWGCTTLNAANDGVENEVEVVMTNVPMKLDTSAVDFTLELDGLDELHAALAEPMQAVSSAVLGSADDDVDALLGAMEEHASDPAAFRKARTSLDWDTELRSALGSGAGLALRSPLEDFMDRGLDDTHLDAGIQGSMRGVAGGLPEVTLSSVFGIPQAKAGFTPSGTPSWEAGADDGVLISMTLSASPATFLLQTAEMVALDEVTDTTSLAEALAATVPCSQVASTLVAHGQTRGYSVGRYDEGGTEQLCAAAVKSLLDAALLSDATPSMLDVALTGAGSVGDDAELNAFSGSWLGHWSLAGGTANLRGPASGAASTSTTR